MSCSCLSRLLAALKPPWVALPALHIPPVALRLGAAAGKMAGLTAAAKASAAVSAAVSASAGLPPLNVAMVAKISAAASAVAQAKLGLGINLLDPTGSSRLSLALSLLPALDLPPLPSMGPLLAGLGAIGSVQASLGVNLLAPGAAASVAASLSAAVTASARLALPALPPLAASYSALANAAAAMGCSTPAAMHSALSALASIQLPAAPGLLAQLLALLQAHSLCTSMLGFSPFTASAQLSAALAPLSLLATAQVSEALTAAESLGSAAPGAITANAGASFAAFAGFSANVNLPNLGVAVGLAAVLGQARTGPCSSGCPIAI